MNDEPHFRHLNHNALPLPATRATALQSAVAYLGDNAAYYRLSEEDLKNLPLVLAPRRQPAQEERSYRLETEKTVGGITSVTFVQTYAGVPVWEAGIGVTLDVRRQRILGSVSTAFDAIDLAIPKKWPRETSLAALKAALGISRTKSHKGQTLRVESERMLVRGEETHAAAFAFDQEPAWRMEARGGLRSAAGETPSGDQGRVVLFRAGADLPLPAAVGAEDGLAGVRGDQDRRGAPAARVRRQRDRKGIHPRPHNQGRHRDFFVVRSSARLS